MDGILWYLGAGTAALFGVAVAVTTWEHLRPARPREPSAPAPAQAPLPAVDVDLGMRASDVERRRGILDDALHRMTQPGTLGDPQAWIETAPMVGPRVEPPEPPKRP